MDGAKKKTNNSMFVNVVVIILGIIGGYLYYSQLIEPNKQKVVVLDINRQDLLIKFKDPELFDFKLLTQPYFRNLKIISESPLLPSVGGKENPFAP